jgi:putative endonuclease
MMKPMQPAVYLLANKPHGTLYAGVTSHLQQRIWQHKQQMADGFTKKYGVKSLVWYELHAEMLAAITREKQIKVWQRAWKVRLIEEQNPTWRDLYDELM